MKRILSLILCLALAAGLAAPVLAEEETAPAEPEEEIDQSAEPQIDLGMLEPGEDTVAFPVPEQEQEDGMDAALAELTLLVKETLEVDDSYTSFSSSYYDGPTPLWDLYWSEEGRELSAEVRPDGTVISVHKWTEDEHGQRFYGFDPAFPALDAEQARAQAERWCGRLFTGAESGRLDDVRIYLGTDGYYRFAGTVLENGLESPISFNMVIGGDGMTSFWRSDQGGYVGQLPAAETDGEGPDPKEPLAGAVELELRWVSDGEGGAKLMYMPVGPRTVVLPDTGEAVDMDALYESLNEKGMNYAGYGAAEATEDAVAMSADGGVSLTETEIASIDNYGDVLDGAALDERLRPLAELGLEGFEQVRCSYAMDAESGDVTASLRYAKTMTEDQLYGFSPESFARAAENGEDLTIYKYFTMDAKTGDLLSLRTGYPLWDRQEAPAAQAEQADLAEAFLDKVAPEQAAQAAGCTLKGYDQRQALVFAQVHEGYFYPDNYLSVHVDPASGVVDEFYSVWDEEVTFGPAEDVVDEDEALAAYTDALDVTLGYVAWPVDITAADDELYDSYIRWGYTYVEELRLAYYYGGTDKVTGVDAVTGEAVRSETPSGTYTYDDLAGVAQADEIEALGAAGVGFSGGQFQPEAELTMRDAVILLMRADGTYAPEDDDEWLAEQAYYQGILPSKEWEPEQRVSRIAFLRLLIGLSKYGYAAQLSGIWDCGFDDVDEADAAVAAIARGLDLAEGDALEPDETLTRADGAEILYKFMDR